MIAGDNMNSDDPPILLPASSVADLAKLLTELDKFLRSDPAIGNALASFLALHGHVHPRFTAYNLVDDVSFTAARLRALAGIAPSTPGNSRKPTVS